MVLTLCFADDPAGLLAEARRVLSSDGHLVIGVVPLDSAWGRSYQEKGHSGHPFYQRARFLTVGEHLRLLGDAGFEVVAGRSSLTQQPTGTPVSENVHAGIVAGAGFVALAATSRDGEHRRLATSHDNSRP